MIGISLSSLDMLIVVSLTIIGRCVKGMMSYTNECGDKIDVMWFKKKATKFLPIVLYFIAVGFEAMVFAIAKQPLAECIIKTFIVTGIACWGYDAVKGLLSKGMQE